jgi:hypothetical protein
MEGRSQRQRLEGSHGHNGRASPVLIRAAGGVDEQLNYRNLTQSLIEEDRKRATPYLRRNKRPGNAKHGLSYGQSWGWQAVLAAELAKGDRTSPGRIWLDRAASL